MKALLEPAMAVAVAATFLAGGADPRTPREHEVLRHVARLLAKLGLRTRVGSTW